MISKKGREGLGRDVGRQGGRQEGWHGDIPQKLNPHICSTKK